MSRKCFSKHDVGALALLTFRVPLSYHLGSKKPGQAASSQQGKGQGGLLMGWALTWHVLTYGTLCPMSLPTRERLEM